MKLMIKNGIYLDISELSFSSDRSSGPGGQAVNKIASKVTLKWFPAKSFSLSESVKKRLIETLNLNKNGALTISSERHRSQLKNKKDCSDKLRALLVKSLQTRKKRIATKVTKSKNEKRLKDKRIRSEIKKMRKDF